MKQKTTNLLLGIISFILSVSVFVTMWKSVLPSILIGHYLLYRWRSYMVKEDVYLARFFVVMGLVLVYVAVFISVVLALLWYFSGNR